MPLTARATPVDLRNVSLADMGVRGADVRLLNNLASPISNARELFDALKRSVRNGSADLSNLDGIPVDTGDRLEKILADYPNKPNDIVEMFGAQFSAATNPVVTAPPPPTAPQPGLLSDLVYGFRHPLGG